MPGKYVFTGAVVLLILPVVDMQITGLSAIPALVTIAFYDLCPLAFPLGALK